MKNAIDAKTNEKLLKIRKGATGAITVKDLVAIGTTIGYQFTPKFELVPLDKEIAAVRDLVRDEMAPRDVYANVREGIATVEIRGEVDGETVRQRVLAVKNKKPKTNALVITNVTTMRKMTSPWGQPINGFTFEVSVWMESYDVTAPNGEKVTVTREPGYTLFTTYKLLPWLNKQGFVAQVNELLGMEEHIPGAQRTLENSGTCGVCLRNVKLRDGKIVAHGYTQMPGRGAHRGDECYGVGFPSYEASAAASDAFLEGRARTALRSAIFAVTTLGILKKKGEKFVERQGQRQIPIDVAIANAESEVKSIENQVAIYEFLVKSWKLRPTLEAGVMEPNYLKGFKGTK